MRTGLKTPKCWGEGGVPCLRPYAAGLGSSTVAVTPTGIKWSRTNIRWIQRCLSMDKKVWLTAKYSMVYIAKEAWPEKKDFLKESMDKTRWCRKLHSNCKMNLKPKSPHTSLPPPASAEVACRGPETRRCPARSWWTHTWYYRRRGNWAAGVPRWASPYWWATGPRSNQTGSFPALCTGTTRRGCEWRPASVRRRIGPGSIHPVQSAGKRTRKCRVTATASQRGNVSFLIVSPLVQWWQYRQQWAGCRGWPPSPRRDRWCWSLHRRSPVGMESLPSAHRQRMGWRLMKCIGDRGEGGAKTKDGLMNVCGMCNEEIREIQRYSKKRSTAGAALKSVSHDMNSRFPRVEAFRTRFQERIRERGWQAQTGRWVWQCRIRMRKEEEHMRQDVTHKGSKNMESI